MTISKFPFLIPHSADKGEAKYMQIYIIYNNFHFPLFLHNTVILTNH